VLVSCTRNLPLRTKNGEDAQRMADNSFVAIICSFHAHCEFGGHLSLCVCVCVFPSYFKLRIAAVILMKFTTNLVPLQATPNSCP